MRYNKRSLLRGGALAVAALPYFATIAQAGAGWGDSTDIHKNPLKVPTYYANSPSGMRPDPLGGPTAIDTGTALRKFVDGLPGIINFNGKFFTSYNDASKYPTLYNADGTNNIHQAMPFAVPDVNSYPGCNYYVIGVVEYDVRMHSDLPTLGSPETPLHNTGLPKSGTSLRGYVQIETPDNVAVSKHVALKYPNGNPILDKQLHQIYAVDEPNYLGPIIATTTGTPVRITYANLLPTGHFNAGERFGDLFLPVDTTLMGAGAGPLGAAELYTQNRIAIHEHGNDAPWISDGTPYQWTAPAGEATSYKVGDSFALVPDMPDPGEGWGTNYYQNDISGRLMFYHDHAVGLTRLNVFAGMAAGYLISDKPGLGENRPGLLPSEQIPLVIQEKTFVPKDVKQLGGLLGATPVGQDEKWDTSHWGQYGDLWFPNVYEFNQDPNSFDGSNPVGRWDYGPWFWPIFPASGTLPTGEFGHATTTPEAFGDTPVVNGTAYPVLNVDPKAYRFRILNASNDRMLNLGLYVAADNTTPTTPGAPGITTLCTDPALVPVNRCTEVKMVPFDTTLTFPAAWGQPDNRAGGVPDPATAGPDIVQIGSEGGLLPAVKDIPSNPVNYEYNKRSVTVLNVLEHGLYLGNAERADAVIDFSQFAGKTLILYNDAPAPVPAGDPRIDYYTGNPDFSGSGGAATTKPGVGPNTRTVLQINVAKTTPATVFDVAALTTALPLAYADTQPKPVVAEKVYDPAFGTSTPYDQYGRIFTGSINQPAFTFTTGDTVTYHPFVAGTMTVDAANLVTVPTGGTAAMPVYNKAIQELFDPYGRMNATLGVEIPFTGANIQTTVPLEYIDPATEVIGDGETQIWKITHNGVDTHPVHFHLVNVQVINRVGWDGTVKVPDPSEFGWKETVKMSPLEDILVAVRANAPKIPFGVPNSVRPLAPAEPLHVATGFSNLNPNTGNAYPTQNRVTNENTNFGWEYVWHCHILGHEENDFMRPLVFKFKSLRPHVVTGVVATPNGANQIDLTWTDPTPTATSYGDHSNEIGFMIERSVNNGHFVSYANVLANHTSYSDLAATAGSTYQYRVVAYNAAGTSPMPQRIGAYINGNWYLDTNANGAWEPGTDFYEYFGTAAMTPVVGDWNGDGFTKVGAYEPSTGTWYLDMNGNGVWDGEPTDRVIPLFGGAPDDIPVVGDWNGDGISEVGVFRQGTNTWYLDYNGNGVYDAAADISAWFGFSGCQPVVGDWNGDGRTKIGVYANAQWFLDANGSFAWEGTPADTIVASFGFPGMLPVAGDWTGTGVSRIGGYYNGDWYLDIDGNGAWNPPTDQYRGPFGAPGMLPVVGNWK